MLKKYLMPSIRAKYLTRQAMAIYQKKPRRYKKRWKALLMKQVEQLMLITPKLSVPLMKAWALLLKRCPRVTKTGSKKKNEQQNATLITTRQFQSAIGSLSNAPRTRMKASST